MEIYIALMVIISLIIIALILITVGNKKKQLDLIITDKPDLSRYSNKTRIKDKCMIIMF